MFNVTLYGDLFEIDFKVQFLPDPFHRHYLIHQEKRRKKLHFKFIEGRIVGRKEGRIELALWLVCKFSAGMHSYILSCARKIISSQHRNSQYNIHLEELL